MINLMYEKLARVVVNYSVAVKKGDRILIEGEAFSKEFFQAIYIEILKAGGHPLVMASIEGLKELFFQYASEEQILYFDEIHKVITKEFDGIITIDSEYNTRNLSLIDPKLIAKYRGSPDHKEMMEIFEDRMAKKELRWVAVPFPCHAFAQEANMDLFSYTEFMEKALFLDKENPIGEWINLEKRQDEIINKLNKVRELQIFGEDTVLKLSIDGRKWDNCCGKENLPDGEVYTGPVEDSANGHIRFTYPGIYAGREIENIYLEFEDGKVVKATADKGVDLLQEIIKMENADKIGEFAIGTNYGITTFTKNMLFDEKIGGTLHMALGMGFQETGSKNKSPIHWDILKDMRIPGSKVLADGKEVYKEGKWLI